MLCYYCYTLCWTSLMGIKWLKMFLKGYSRGANLSKTQYGDMGNMRHKINIFRIYAMTHLSHNSVFSGINFFCNWYQISLQNSKLYNKRRIAQYYYKRLTWTLTSHRRPKSFWPRSCSIWHTLDAVIWAIFIFLKMEPIVPQLGQTPRFCEAAIVGCY